MSRGVGSCVVVLVATALVAGCGASGAGGGTVVAAPVTDSPAVTAPAASSAEPTSSAARTSPAAAPATTPTAGAGRPAPARTTAPAAPPPPTAATSTPSVLAPPVTAPQPPAEDGIPSLSHWAGTWERHGEEITLDADGHGTMVFRAGVWCSMNPAPPCDSITDNEIVDGGYATFHLSYVNPDQPEASGYMDSTNEPVPLRPVTVSDQESDPSDPYRPGSITVTGLDADPAVYCAPGFSAPDNACGA